MLIAKMTLEEIYLDWINNFQSIQCFADYHGISEKDAIQLINICRNIGIIPR